MITEHNVVSVTAKRARLTRFDGAKAFIGVASIIISQPADEGGLERFWDYAKRASFSRSTQPQSTPPMSTADALHTLMLATYIQMLPPTCRAASTVELTTDAD